MTSLFITATDTDAGKTYVARLLTQALVNAGKKVAVYKPISAGCEQVAGQLVNEDALFLQKAANSGQSLDDINPIAFCEPIAPHIAAQTLEQPIDFEEIQQGFERIKALHSDVVITEGAGGWRLPLGGGHFMSEFVKDNQLNVILVVNMKLGCLNHAVLTKEAIERDGLNCIAWVANCQQNMPYLAENIQELQSLLDVPMLAQLQHEPAPEKNIDRLNLDCLV